MKWKWKQAGVPFTLKVDVYVFKKNHVFFVIIVKVWMFISMGNSKTTEEDGGANGDGKQNKTKNYTEEAELPGPEE